jgi:hypothetical protein
MAEKDSTTRGPSKGDVLLTLNQQDGIGKHLYEMKTLVSVMVAASTGRDEFDTEGFALMLEDKFAELYDTYHETIGREHRYQRFSSR